MWSLGISLVELARGKHPYERPGIDSGGRRRQQDYVSDDMYFATVIRDPDRTPSLSAESADLSLACVDLVDACLVRWLVRGSVGHGIIVVDLFCALVSSLLCVRRGSYLASQLSSFIVPTTEC